MYIDIQCVCVCMYHLAKNVTYIVALNVRNIRFTLLLVSGVCQISVSAFHEKRDLRYTKRDL